jgi:hypothetical protein
VNHGDNVTVHQDAWLVDGRRKYDRKMIAPVNQLYYTGRRDVPPVPDISPNKKGIYWGAHSEWLEPASLRGTRSLSIKWIERSRDYGGWSWSSATRRIVRRSTAQRQDALGGSDACLDDTFVYQWAVNAQTYKLLGRKELLLARHQDLAQIKNLHVEGQCLFSGTQRERINTYVVEAIHKDRNYLYSKQMYYIDPETWAIAYADKYDRRGRLWKIFDSVQRVITSDYNDLKIPMTEFTLLVDVQRQHSTGMLSVSDMGVVDEYHTTQYYNPRALQKYGY